MIINSQIPLHRLVLTLSEALDYICPALTDHQQRVAYVSLATARELGLPHSERYNVFLAAALHDIGLIRAQDREQVRTGHLEAVAWHGEAGYELLKDNPLLAGAAETVRYHHVKWAFGRGLEQQGRRVPFQSHIVQLGDVVERAIDRETPVLEQAASITDLVARQAETVLHPDCVDAFRAASRPESFWLDCTSPRIYGVLLQMVDWPLLTVDEETIQPIARTFAHVVDSASRWTATHTAGVAACALELARELGLSPRELNLMQAAGFFHDIGKLAVPTAILDKQGSLTDAERRTINTHTYYTFQILNTIGGMPQIAEWAAFHHERLDGTGYPFRHHGRDLTLGARIMAVADVFTALAEDRPYRHGLPRKKVLSILEQEVRGGGLDGDVVKTLARAFEKIDEVRRNEQAEYAEKQERLRAIMNSLSGEPRRAVQIH